MSYTPWLEINSQHPFFSSNKMEFLGIFPNNQTEIWLKNHRHLYKHTNEGFLLSCQLTSDHNLEIVPVNEPVDLVFYLGTKDLNFTSYTSCEDKPLYYFQRIFNIDLIEQSPEKLEIDFKSAEIIEETKPILLPLNYSKFGELRITLNSPSDFILKSVNNNPTSVTIIGEPRSYSLIYAVKKSGNEELKPKFIDEEAGITTFSLMNAENSNYDYFLSDKEISLVDLKRLECVAYTVHNENNRIKLKCKVPRFGLASISKSPSYPHFAVLLQEIKY